MGILWFASVLHTDDRRQLSVLLDPPNNSTGFAYEIIGRK